MPLFLNTSRSFSRSFSLILTFSIILPFLVLRCIYAFSLFFHSFPHSLFLSHIHSSFCSLTCILSFSLTLSYFNFSHFLSRTSKKSFTVYELCIYTIIRVSFDCLTRPTVPLLADGWRSYVSPVTYNFGFVFPFCVFLQFINYEIRRGFFLRY